MRAIKNHPIRGAVAVAMLGSALCVLGSASWTAAKAPACAGGRYVISNAPRSNGKPALQSGTITFDGATVSLGEGCSGVARTRRAKAPGGGTRIVAALSSCANTRGRVRLTASIDITCKRMWGSVATKSGKSRFDAQLSLCGNGAIDAGEECDGSACSDGAGCDACRCDRDGIPGPGCTPAVDPGCAAGGSGSTTTTIVGGGTTTSTSPDGGTTTTTTAGGASTTTSTLPPRDPFKCYKLREQGSSRFQPGPLSLVDQFGASSDFVKAPERLCNPVDVDGAGIADPTTHLMCYDLAPEPGFIRRNVVSRDQFGDHALVVVRPDSLCVPAEKDGVQSETALDGFKCYRVARQKGLDFGPRSVSLADQFETKTETVQKPILFCNPVSPSGESLADPETHLTCYRIPAPPEATPRDVSVEDEFTEQHVRAFRGTCRKVGLLCVPSIKDPGAGTTTTTIATPTSTSTSSTAIGSTTSITVGPQPTTTTTLPPTCGNGMTDTGEECDDGNTNPGDGCTDSCTICGNNQITAPETCDDGNTLVDDNCPEDCQVASCTPTAEPVQTVTITASRSDLTSIRFFLDYPDGQVALAGGPGPDLPAGTITDTPGDPTPFDLEHAIRILVSAGFTFDTTTIAKIDFLGCAGQPVPPASAYGCTVIDASDGSFQNVAGVTCTVSGPGGPTTTTTIASSTTSTSTTASTSSTATTPSTTVTSTSLVSTSTLPGPTTSTSSSSTTSAPSPSTSTSSSSSTSTPGPSTTSTTIGGGTACSANGLDVTVSLDYPQQIVGGVSAIFLRLTYPAPLVIPGTGTEATVRQRVTNLAGTGSSVSSIADRDTNTNGVDDQLQAAARKTQGSLDPGPVYRARFECAAGTNVSPTAFGCSQEQATDLSGSPFAPELSNLIGCVVALSSAP
jgi:cysteine-rich repeat protein